MIAYVEHLLNLKGKEIYDQQEEKYEAYLQSLKQAEQQTKSKAKDKTHDQALIRTLEDKPQNTFSLQIILSPQNISSHSPLPDQSPPQNSVSSLSEHLPPQIIPPPQIGQHAGPTRTDQSPIQDINANNLTMQQAVELFELLQARKTREAEKSVTVEAQPVERAPRRNEPLSFLTLGTVEGIVGSADPGTVQEQTSWEGKMEKFMNLSHTYSSDNTISGEKCYMIDEALYKNILLAVAEARKQNELALTIASAKLEQHMSSNYPYSTVKLLQDFCVWKDLGI
jgi:hypothetical protein